MNLNYFVYIGAISSFLFLINIGKNSLVDAIVSEKKENEFERIGMKWIVNQKN